MPVDAEPDSTLIALARRPGAETWGRVIDRHGEGIHRTAVAVMRDPHEAVDVVQEALLHGRRHARLFRPRASEVSMVEQERRWLQRVVINVGLNWRRERERRTRRERPGLE